MNEGFNKKLAEMLGKMDEKVLQARLNAAMEMLKKGNTEELAKKINKIDKEELLKKMSEFDESKLKDLKINKDELKQKISGEDLDKLAALIGDQGDEVIKKIKDIIK
jgi:flavodoxin